METKIGEVKGYTITYDVWDKLFHLKNAEGEEVGSGKTQEEVETQADKLSKQQFQFPIRALESSGLNLLLGKVTSVNLSDRSIRFVSDKKGSSHHKVSLRYGAKVCESTPINDAIKTKVDTHRQAINNLEEEIRELIGQLEKPINLDHFGLK